MKLLEVFFRKIFDSEDSNLWLSSGGAFLLGLVYLCLLAEKLVTFSDVALVLMINAALFALLMATIDELRRIAREDEQDEAEKKKAANPRTPRSPFSRTGYPVGVRPPDDTVNGDLYFGPYGRRYGNTSPNDRRRYGNTSPNDGSRCGNVAPSYGRRYGNTSPNDDSRCQRK
mgnify:CR=1 FL=1